MRILERRAQSLERVPFACLLIICVMAGVTCWAGCGKGDTAATPGPAAAGPTGGDASGPASGSEGKTDASGKPTAANQPAPRQVLDSMVAAYKKASVYDDKGYVEIQYQLGGEQLGDKANFMVALARPNKVRVQAYGGVVVSDSQKLWGAMMGTPSQVLQREAPAAVTIGALYPNLGLADAMAMGPTQAFSWLPMQAILLLADDPLKTLLYESKGLRMLEPAKIDEHACYRVAVERADGTGVFWIDQASHVLRRFQFPTDALRAMAAERHRVPSSQLRNMSLVAELKDAQFGGAVDPKAFEFQVPAGAKVVEDFVPDDIWWLGKPAPDFSFVDLSGNPVTPKWLAGKVAVIEFWATWCDFCRMTLPDIEEVYQKYKQNDKVVFVAVSVDEPSVSDQTLRDTFQELGVTMPIARDPEQNAYTKFQVEAYPTSVILGSGGVVEHRQSGGDQPGIGAIRLSARLEKLLAGQALHQETLQKYRESYEAQKKRFEQLFQKCIKDDLYLMRGDETPRAEIAESTEPKSLKLTRLWSCTELAAPGNILVLERADQPPRLFVLESGNSVAEIAPGGNVVSLKPLAVPPQEPVFFLRSAAGADGRRYFVGTALGVQQVHLWDEDFNRLMSFPKDAPENRHAGIADVRIADFNGDGALELAVSYFGEVGVQGVSLAGERVWANKSVVQSLRLAVLGPDAQGQRPLLCMNSQGGLLGTLVILGPKGELQGEFSVPGRAIAWLEAADLDADGQPEICGLAPVEAGNVEAIGLNLKGEELWSYPLPRGVHLHQIEAVTAGKLFADQPALWLLAAADGTIHILDAKGKLVDVFAYGKVLTGLGTAEWDGKRVLLVSTENSVDAWQVEPSANAQASTETPGGQLTEVPAATEPAATKPAAAEPGATQPAATQPAAKQE